MHGTHRSVPRTVAGAAPIRRPARLLAWLALCLRRRRERLGLGELSDDQLKDIGLSRADVARECGRWPWDGRSGDR